MIISVLATSQKTEYHQLPRPDPATTRENHLCWYLHIPQAGATVGATPGRTSKAQPDRAEPTICRLPGRKLGSHGFWQAEKSSTYSAAHPATQLFGPNGSDPRHVRWRA